MASDEIGLDQPTDASGRRLIWNYGINDHMEELPADKLKDFKPSGTFRTDFACLSAKCGVVAHPGFLPPVSKAKAGSKRPTPENQNDSEQVGGTVLALQSVLVGRASMLVFRHVMPSCLNIEVLRLTSCCLDIEAVGLLRAGLAESCSVAVLQLDWNPVEVPIDAAALKTAFETNQPQEINALEKKCEQQQAERTLRALGEQLASRFGDVSSAMKALQKAAIGDRIQHEATAGVEPFPLSTWAEAFHSVLNKGSAEADKIFSIIDGPLYGTGDGFVSFDFLEDILQNLPPLTPEEEAADPIGKAFGMFVDGTSPLDVVSFRHCSIGRLECMGIGKALCQSQHLRAINLWGNDICDLGAAALAESFEVYYGLQSLGLGRNLITHVGLEKLCAPLGFTRIDDKAQAGQIDKEIKDRMKELEKRKKNPPVPKKDLRGNDRYLPDFFIPTCEANTDENGDYWLWGRNMTLKTLNLEHNPITDAAAVMQLQPMGVGNILLRGVPCAEELSQLVAAASRAAELGEGDPSQAPAEEEKGKSQGWTFIFK